MTNTFGRTGLVACALALAACSAQPAPAPDTRAADEAALRTLIEAWAASARAKDAEKFVSFYADDATLMIEDAPDIAGVAALREALPGMMNDPNFALSFAADKVEVARSGELAYEKGTYTMTMSDPQQQAVTERGHYVVVWRKQADGSWKVILDVPVSDPPEATAQAGQD
jgi:uncharacterized protein (TIGR02246 family)